MRSTKWSTSEAVWIEEIDDEHKEIFADVARLQAVLSGDGPLDDMHKAMERLTTTIVGHFEHEERLMRASRYGSHRWHTGLHEAAQQNVERFAPAIERGDREAGRALVEYLTEWLRDHARVADRMMCAHLRNECLGVGKLVFRVGTKPAESCTWIDSRGDAFDPLAETKGL
jgi:hemerythrin-like metal-binding protein